MPAPLIESRLPTPIRNIVLAACLLWAVFVLVCYLFVDNSYLLDPGRSYASTAWRIGLPAIATLLVSTSFGHALSRGWRGRSTWVFVVALVTVILICSLSSKVAEVFAETFALKDGLRGFIVVCWAAVFGAGLQVGANLAGRNLSARAWNLLTLVPFLVITALANAWIPLLFLSGILIVARSIGTAGLRLWRAAPGTDEPFVLSTAVGLATVIMAGLGLGLSGLTSPVGISVFFAVCILVCHRRVVATIRELPRLGFAGAASMSVSGAAAHGALVALVIVFFIAALAPETGADAMGFRVAGPVHWLRAEAVVALPEMLGSYTSCAAEVLYLLALPFLGLSVAKLVQFGLAVLIIVSVRKDVFAADSTGTSALWPFLFFGSTLMWTQFAYGFADTTQLFFIYATVLAIRRWLDSSRDSLWLVTAGITAGAATAIKLNGGIAGVIAGGVFLMVTWRRRSGIRTYLRGTAALAVPFLLVLTPWLLRSWALTGNPVFPFANGFFASPLSTLEAPAAYFGIGTGLLDLLRLPWALFFDPSKFSEIGTYNPALLSLLPLGIAGLLASRARAGLWIWGAVFSWLAWTLTEQNSRYSLFAGLFATITIGFGCRSWAGGLAARTRQAVAGLVLVVALLGFGLHLCRPVSWLWGGIAGSAMPTSVVLGDLSAHRYLKVMVPSYRCGQWLNRHVGTRARVWQMRGIRDHLYYDARVTSLPHGVLPQVLPLAKILREPEYEVHPSKIYDRLRQLGYTHVLYSTARPKVIHVPDTERPGVLSRSFGSRYLAPRCAHRDMRLYEILRLPREQTDVDTRRGDNLLANPRASWEVTGGVEVIDGAGGKALRLPPDSRASQAVSIEPDALYALELRIVSRAEGTTLNLQMNWLDARGKLVLFWIRPVTPGSATGTFEFLQSAPPDAATAYLYISGGDATVEGLAFRKVLTSNLPPRDEK